MLFTPTRNKIFWSIYGFILRNGTQRHTGFDASRSHIESEIAASQNYTETIFDDHFYIKNE